MVLIIVLAVALSGCNLVRVNEEKDRKLVVAKVNGIEILKERFSINIMPATAILRSTIRKSC